MPPKTITAQMKAIPITSPAREETSFRAVDRVFSITIQGYEIGGPVTSIGDDRGSWPYTRQHKPAHRFRSNSRRITNRFSSASEEEKLAADRVPYNRKGMDEMIKGIEESLQLQLGEYLPLLQSRIMEDTYYFGVKTLKNPFDFWVYQEIIHEMQPDVIVEIGNYWGGSTLALAHQLDLHGHGRVMGIDIDHSNVHDSVRRHPRIRLFEGDAVECFDEVAAEIGPAERVLVIEDSSHTLENTLAVMRTYSALTKPGDYLIVEDGICHHGLDEGPSPGPYEAITAFLQENSRFEIDRQKESFLITWNPRGSLRRKRE